MLILAVDDYPILADVIATTLRGAGHTVLTASSAHEAKRILCERTDVELLITDLEMPHINGDELADWAIRENPDLNVLLMSSEPVPLALQARFLCLQKPFRPTFLLRLIHHFSTLPSSFNLTPFTH